MPITEKTQAILEAADALEEVLSITVGDVPSHLLSQVGEGDYVYFELELKMTNGDVSEAGFVIPTAILDDVDNFVGGIKELTECGCTRIGELGDVYCVDNPFYNRGKATYLIRYPDMYQVKLEDAQPELVVIPNEQQRLLLDKLYELDKVKEIVLEKVLDKRLIEQNGEDAIIVAVSIVVDSSPQTNHWVNFVAPASVWDNELGHEWAVENLKGIIKANNE